MDIVEVRRNGYSVAAEMGQMRDWLNARRIVPVLFQFDGAVLRLGLESEDEATAFADAFDGRVLSEADLLSRWKRSTASSGEYNFRPIAPNQQWHTDVMYVWVAARFYFLVSFVDAFSRYIVHHKLLISLDGKSLAIELQAAMETVQGARPRIVHDHGSEFVNRDVAAVIKTHNLIDIRTKPRHPESNGIVERFNGTVRAESDDDYGNNYLQAEAIISRLMHHYNEERLHATLGYMTPATWHRGQPDEVRNERARRIAAARAHRKMTNQQRFTRAA